MGYFLFHLFKKWLNIMSSFQVAFLLLCKRGKKEEHIFFMGHKVPILASFINFSNLFTLVSISKDILKIIFCLRNYNNDQRNGSWNKFYSLQAVSPTAG